MIRSDSRAKDADEGEASSCSKWTEKCSVEMSVYGEELAKSSVAA